MNQLITHVKDKSNFLSAFVIMFTRMELIYLPIIVIIWVIIESLATYTNHLYIMLDNGN